MPAQDTLMDTRYRHFAFMVIYHAAKEMCDFSIAHHAWSAWAKRNEPEQAQINGEHYYRCRCGRCCRSMMSKCEGGMTKLQRWLADTERGWLGAPWCDWWLERAGWDCNAEYLQRWAARVRADWRYAEYCLESTRNLMTAIGLKLDMGHRMKLPAASDDY